MANEKDAEHLNSNSVNSMDYSLGNEAVGSSPSSSSLSLSDTSSSLQLDVTEDNDVCITYVNLQGSTHMSQHCQQCVQEQKQGLQHDTSEIVPEKLHKHEEKELDYTQPPKLIAKADKEFTHKDNFLKGCKWSSNGRFLLSNSEDHVLRVFTISEHVISESCATIPELGVCCRVREPEIIYDYCWLEDASPSSLPQPPYILSSSKDQPIHLFSVDTTLCTAQTRATYKAYNQVDEPVSAHSIHVCKSDNLLYGGYVKCIRLFDLNRAGKHIAERTTYDKSSGVGQKGIISCIDYDTNYKCYAAGSYDNTVAVYESGRGECVGVLTGHRSGVTSAKFTEDGRYLYSATRMDSELLCWDMRALGNVVFSLKRAVTTNQRYYFDLWDSDKYLVSGHSTGEVSVWRTLHHPSHETSNQYATTCSAPASQQQHYIEPAITFQPHFDACTSVSIHPNGYLLATGSGQRHFLTDSDTSSCSSSSGEEDNKSFPNITDHKKQDAQSISSKPQSHYTDNSIRIWSFGTSSHVTAAATIT